MPGVLPSGPQGQVDNRWAYDTDGPNHFGWYDLPAGDYTFSVYSDEAAFLWLDNSARTDPRVAADAVVQDPGPHVARATTGSPVFLAAGPHPLLALYGENAVTKNREIMGATDPAKAAPGTIRALFGENVGANAVHGSDSPESAMRELNLFFKETEFVNKK